MSETEHAGQEQAEYPDVDEGSETTALHELNEMHPDDQAATVIPPPGAVHYFASIGIWDGGSYTYADAQTATDAKALLAVAWDTGRDHEGHQYISILFKRASFMCGEYSGELHFRASYEATQFVEMLEQRDAGFPPLNDAIENEQFFVRQRPSKVAEFAPA
jgi:hypothetical protein